MQTSPRLKKWCLRNPKAFDIPILIAITLANSKPGGVTTGIANALVFLTALQHRLQAAGS